MGTTGQRLTLFDLDNTLLAGDSDYGWGQFLIEVGAVDAASYEQRNAEFFADYKAGRLDIHAFQEFQLRPLAKYEPAQLFAWRDRFLEEKIRPMVLPAAEAIVRQRLGAGDLVAVVTSTNSFVTQPIAQMYGITNLVATEPEMVAGRFTGRVAGVPCFQAGKVIRVEAWLARQERKLDDFSESWFYTDSHNDLPLLNVVSHAVAVDPDPILAERAAAHGWQIVSWREDPPREA